MYKAKTVTTALGQQFGLSVSQSPQTEEEKEYMNSVPYASGVLWSAVY